MSELSFDLLEELKSFESKLNELEKRRDELLKAQSEIDKKITDIEHCAEFYELDAYRGYKLYKILHEAGIERRKIKNETTAIINTLSKLSSKSTYNAIKSVERAFGEKEYKPRVVDELFDLIK